MDDIQVLSIEKSTCVKCESYVVIFLKNNTLAQLVVKKNIPKWHVFTMRLDYLLRLWGGWVLNGYCFQVAHFSYNMKHVISTRWFSNS